MFCQKDWLKIASLRIGKHCIVKAAHHKNITLLRKLNIVHPYKLMDKIAVLTYWNDNRFHLNI